MSFTTIDSKKQKLDECRPLPPNTAKSLHEHMLLDTMGIGSKFIR